MLRLLPASFVGVYPPYVGSKRNVVPLRIVVESESLGRASVGPVFPCALGQTAIALTVTSVEANATEQIRLHFSVVVPAFLEDSLAETLFQKSSIQRTGFS